MAVVKSAEMIIEKKDNTLIITLDEDCTIINVEADYDKIRGCALETDGIEVIAVQVQEMDTAYFQLLLSIRATAVKNNISFRISNTAGPVREIEAVYGIFLN